VLVALAKEGGENVLTDAFSPEMVAAIAARVGRRVEIHPVFVAAARYAVSPEGDALAVKTEAALQTVQVDASRGVEVNLYFGHVHCSQSKLQYTRPAVGYTLSGRTDEVKYTPETGASSDLDSG
jgi:hypothetical protein